MPKAVITTIYDHDNHKIGIEIVTNDTCQDFRGVKKALIKCSGVQDVIMYENEPIGDILQFNYVNGENDQLHFDLIDEIDGDTNITSTEILYQKLKEILRQ